LITAAKPGGGAMKQKYGIVSITIISILLVSLAGCSSDSTEPASNESLSLSISTFDAAKTGFDSPLAGLSSDTLTVGSDVLILDQVQLVLREIELKRASAEDCQEEDDCEKFEIGPVLIELPLNGDTVRMVEIDIDPDTYNEIEFDLHRPSGDGSEDQAFLLDHPEFEDTSVKVEGSFNGEAFVYESDLSVEQEIDLTPPLIIYPDEMFSNVTLRVLLNDWFLDSSGALIDPSTANSGEPNEGVVENNIQASIEAFEDRDEDGDHLDESED
jgi:hypothetical protein